MSCSWHCVPGMCAGVHIFYKAKVCCNLQPTTVVHYHLRDTINMTVHEGSFNMFWSMQLFVIGGYNQLTVPSNQLNANNLSDRCFIYISPPQHCHSTTSALPQHRLSTATAPGAHLSTPQHTATLCDFTTPRRVCHELHKRLIKNKMLFHTTFLSSSSLSSPSPPWAIPTHASQSPDSTIHMPPSQGVKHRRFPKNTQQLT